MNDLSKILVGAAIGAGLGWLVGEWYVETHIVPDDMIDFDDEEDLEELEELDLDNPESDDNYQILTRNQKKLEKNNRTIKNYTTYFNSINRPDLAALAAKYNHNENVEPIGHADAEIVGGELVVNATFKTAPAREEEEVEGLHTEEELQDRKEARENKDPAVISLKEFVENTDYAHFTLNFYEDDVVTDEQDNPVSRPERILGDDALVSFGGVSEDDDVVYVRNHSKKSMYEIVRTNKNYSAPQPRRRALSAKKEKENDNEEANS